MASVIYKLHISVLSSSFLPTGMDFNTNHWIKITKLGAFDSGAYGIERPITGEITDAVISFWLYYLCLSIYMPRSESLGFNSQGAARISSVHACRARGTLGRLPIQGSFQTDIASPSHGPLRPPTHV